MDSSEGKGRKNMAVRTWERWQSLCRRARKSSLFAPFSPSSSFSRNKHSKPSEVDDQAPVRPKGYFPVYVGAEKQRFVIKTQLVNHSLFKMLLEEAELEYGYSNGGPLLLPCHVDYFYQVLAEMGDGGDPLRSPFCGFFSFLSTSPRQGETDM